MIHIQYFVFSPLALLVVFVHQRNAFLLLLFAFVIYENFLPSFAFNGSSSFLLFIVNLIFLCYCKNICLLHNCFNKKSFLCSTIKNQFCVFFNSTTTPFIKILIPFSSLEIHFSSLEIKNFKICVR